MLKHTFLHLPGIGCKIERKLWSQGFLCWDDCLRKSNVLSLLRSDTRDSLAEGLSESREQLSAGNARYFEERLSSSEAWRLYRDFGDSVAFVDIETTGLWAGIDAITVVGLFNGQETKAFIKGVNLDEFAEEIQKYRLMVTFNGKRFDVPFLRYSFGELPDHLAHLDLRYPLRSLGYRGGLKRIEAHLGLEREGALKEVEGFMAVLLWREHVHGNPTALDTLVRYNLEDVVNMQYLADVAYNQAVLQLPIKVDILPVHPKYEVDTAFDPELIRYLRRSILNIRW